MEVNFNKDLGFLQIENAKIIFRNFRGESSKFNREGDMSFAVLIPDQTIANNLINDGYNVKIKPPREDGETPFMYITVKVKFNNNGPAVYLNSGNKITKLTKETIAMLDDIDIISCNMDLRPYHWEVNGNTGITLYLQAIDVRQKVDRFGQMYAEQLNDQNKNDDLPF